MGHHADIAAGLVRAIEAAAAELGVAPSTIGERAGQGGRFYARLKEGKRVWPETAASVMARIHEMSPSLKSPETVACLPSEDGGSAGDGQGLVSPHVQKDRAGGEG